MATLENMGKDTSIYTPGFDQSEMLWLFFLSVSVHTGPAGKADGQVCMALQLASPA